MFSPLKRFRFESNTTFFFWMCAFVLLNHLDLENGKKLFPDRATPSLQLLTCTFSVSFQDTQEQKLLKCGNDLLNRNLIRLKCKMAIIPNMERGICHKVQALCFQWARKMDN